MSENCNGNCSACGESCDSRQAESLLAQANPLSSVKKVIAVVSGKGGVGKSTVTSMLAVEMNRRGYKTAVLDADITGPYGRTRRKMCIRDRYGRFRRFATSWAISLPRDSNSRLMVIML